jgi:Mce-associated membrane protein
MPRMRIPFGRGSSPLDASERPDPGPAQQQEPAEKTKPAERSGMRQVSGAAIALAVAAAVAAGLAGWSWYGAAHDGDASFARARDTALAAGEQAVQNMNTLDHGDIDHGLDIWEGSTTGDLHTQLVQGRADFEKQVRQAQTVSTAKVLSGAVTELDTRTGKASVMVALQITVTAPKSKPAVKESRLLGELTRTKAGWKLSALGQAPMGDSAADPSQPAASPSTPPPSSPPEPSSSQPSAGR